MGSKWQPEKLKWKKAWTELVHSTKWSTSLGHDTWVRKVQVDEDVGKLLVIKKKSLWCWLSKEKCFSRPWLFYLDEVITNVSGAIDAKYRQIALRSVLVHKPLNLGYICIWTPWSNGNWCDDCGWHWFLIRICQELKSAQIFIAHTWDV